MASDEADPVLSHYKMMYDQSLIGLRKSIQEKDKSMVEKISKLEEKVQSMQKDKNNYDVAMGNAQKLLATTVAEKMEYKKNLVESQQKYSEIKKAYEELRAEKVSLDVVMDIVSNMQTTRRKRVGSIDEEGGTLAKKLCNKDTLETIGTTSGDKTRSFTPPVGRNMLFPSMCIKKEANSDKNAGKTNAESSMVAETNNNISCVGAAFASRTSLSKLTGGQNGKLSSASSVAVSRVDVFSQIRPRIQLNINNGKTRLVNKSTIAKLLNKVYSTEKPKSPADANQNIGSTPQAKQPRRGN